MPEMTTVPFSMRLEEELRDSLSQEAKLVDRPASYLASKAIEYYLDRQKHERELLRSRLDEAKAGVFVSEDSVNAWVDSWFTENELPKPE